MNDLVCWHCGAGIENEPLPLSRNAMCEACRRDQRCCRMCIHYDASLMRSCIEDRADPPREKQRSNFCEYFKPRSNAYAEENQSPTEAARRALGDLFSDAAPPAGEDSPTSLDDLFDPGESRP